MAAAGGSWKAGGFVAAKSGGKIYYAFKTERERATFAAYDRGRERFAPRVSPEAINRASAARRQEASDMFDRLQAQRQSKATSSVAHIPRLTKR